MKVKYILHEVVNIKQLQEIITIKQIAWPYSAEEQLKWITENIKKEDVHVLLLNEENKIVAYLNLIEIQINIEGVSQKALGIGNVCASKKGNGDGARLIMEVNKYLINNNRIGLLFCNTKLVGFYNRLGWNIVPIKNATIKNEKSKEVNTLIYNYKEKIKKIEYTGSLF